MQSGIAPMAGRSAAALALASALTAGMAAWLCTVIVFVLPQRDPTHVPFWSGVALAFLAFSALSSALLLSGRWRGPLQRAVRTAGILALVAGSFAAARTILLANAGRHFEGYLLLMGVLLAAHGVIAIVHTRRDARPQDAWQLS